MLMSLTLTAKEACVTREWVAVNGGWHWRGTTSASTTLLSYISLLTWWRNITHIASMIHLSRQITTWALEMHHFSIELLLGHKYTLFGHQGWQGSGMPWG